MHSQPKPQPKSAATSKATGTGATRGKKTARGRGGRNARPAKKTADELDSDMADYFQNDGAAATEGAAQPAATGDAPMEDDIMVRQSISKNDVLALTIS